MSALTFYRSALGKKTVMAISGIVMFGFVLVHMLGNLKLYQGEEKLNHYAEWLREVGSPALPHGGMLWIFRIVLLAAVLLHAWSAWQLTRMSWKARPQDYSRRDVVQATYASRTVRWGGVIVGLFILYHLAHLTLGWAHSDFQPGEVYRNVVAAFQVWWVSAIYLLAQVALCLHLYHGLWSLFQTLGWYRAVGGGSDWRRRFAQVFAGVVFLGNVSFPLSVLRGWVR
jgi:succinate dehydrogenase / fumarate reductase cytochrome b subunit